MFQTMNTLTLQVGLDDRSYPIIIEDGLLTRIGRDLAERKIGTKYGVIADDHVASLYGSTLMNSFAEAGITAKLFTFPQGEESKNLQTFGTLHRELAQAGFDRSDVLVGLGGGVTGDMTGFVAATYMRGIPFVQVPTTLLAQVDSSVGGKTGVDIPEGKNLVGAFYQPQVVYIDTAVLTTLPMKEYCGGLAEVIKYGVIRDKEFFLFLEDNIDPILSLDRVTIQKMIFTCCRIKADVVAEDERNQISVEFSIMVIQSAMGLRLLPIIQSSMERLWPWVWLPPYGLPSAVVCVRGRKQAGWPHSSTTMVYLQKFLTILTVTASKVICSVTRKRSVSVFFMCCRQRSARWL